MRRRLPKGQADLRGDAADVKELYDTYRIGDYLEAFEENRRRHDQGIRELNRDFLGVDAPTDVLAFSAQEGDKSFVVSPEGQQYLGDVIISYPRALAQASEMGHSLELELHLLIVHGMGDSNVLFQDAVQLAEKLIQEGNLFGQIYYPQENHGFVRDETWIDACRRTAEWFDRYLKQ